MTSADYALYRDWKGWTERPFGFCPPDLAVYFPEELRRSGISSVAGKTLLEVGSGNGEFAGWARSAGADYHGTELIGDLVEQGARSGFAMHDGQQPLETLLGAQSVDIIVAFDVLEHLDAEALRTMLRSARLALRSSGRLIVRVPSGDSPFSRAIQHGDATHRTTMGSSMVHQVARDAGFNVESVREPAFPLWGLGLTVFLRRASIAALRSIGFAAITRIFMGGGRPVLTPNMVFVLVKP